MSWSKSIGGIALCLLLGTVAGVLYTGCPSRCGNGICDRNETVFDCSLDCGYCGDGLCDFTESFPACPEDCGWWCSSGGFYCPDDTNACCTNISCGCCPPSLQFCDIFNCCTD